MKINHILSLFFAIYHSAIFAEKHHDAHTHGEATLEIGATGNTIEIEFEAPGSDTIGSEEQKLSSLEQSQLAKIQERFEKQMKELLPWVNQLQCDVVKAKLSYQAEEDHHGEVEGKATLNCKTPFNKSAPLKKVSIDLSPLFLHPKEVELTLRVSAPGVTVERKIKSTAKAEFSFPHFQ